jgi:predicted metal-dependent HD superfamily phosphohydrolase
MPSSRDRHLHHLAHLIEAIMSTAADLTKAVADLTDVVAKLPAPQPQLITQAELDAATTGVTAATADIAAKTPPTP